MLRVLCQPARANVPITTRCYPGPSFAAGQDQGRREAAIGLYVQYMRSASAGHREPEAPRQRGSREVRQARDGITVEEFIAAAGPIASGTLRKAIRRGHVRLEERRAQQDTSHVF